MRLVFYNGMKDMNNENIITIKKDILIGMLRMAYESGYGGYLDLSHSYANGVIEEYLDSDDGKQVGFGFCGYQNNEQRTTNEITVGGHWNPGSPSGIPIPPANPLDIPNVINIDWGIANSASMRRSIDNVPSSASMSQLTEAQRQQINAEGQQPIHVTPARPRHDPDYYIDV